MAKKFIVKPKSEDKKDDRFVIMSLRIERSSRKNMMSLQRKVIDPEMN